MDGSCLCENQFESKSKSRWNILRKLILQKRFDKSALAVHSKRCFSSFNLFSCEHCKSNTSRLDSDSATTACICTSTCNDPYCQWVLYKPADSILNPAGLSFKSVWIRLPDPAINLQELMGFNNTGNVCIWPAEEVLAYYCLSHNNRFSGKSVIELGGGYSCLGGLCLAANTQSPNSVLLTDGNEKCVESLHAVIKMNSSQLQTVNILADCIRWDVVSSYQKYKSQFDFVICADCLFFDDCRQGLADAIYDVLKPKGCAIIFAPKRGSTLQDFINICTSMFCIVRTSENYSDHIMDVHHQELKQNLLYQPDIHYPVLIELFKSE